LVESTLVAKLATQIDVSVGDALDKAVLGKILPTAKPSFLFAKRYTTGVNGTPEDVLESWLHALDMGTGVQNLGIPIGVLHPVMPTPDRETTLGMQAQMDVILEQLNDQEVHILTLQEANAVAQTNTIAMMRSAMSSEVCEIGGESFDLELAARAFGLANRVGEMPTCAIDAVPMLQVAHNKVIDTASAVEATSEKDSTCISPFVHPNVHEITCSSSMWPEMYASAEAFTWFLYVRTPLVIASHNLFPPGKKDALTLLLIHANSRYFLSPIYVTYLHKQLPRDIW
jgi:hypothetical protein